MFAAVQLPFYVFSLATWYGFHVVTTASTPKKDITKDTLQSSIFFDRMKVEIRTDTACPVFSLICVCFESPIAVGDFLFTRNSLDFPLLHFYLNVDNVL